MSTQIKKIHDLRVRCGLCLQQQLCRCFIEPQFKRSWSSSRCYFIILRRLSSNGISV